MDNDTEPTLRDKALHVVSQSTDGLSAHAVYAACKPGCSLEQVISVLKSLRYEGAIRKEKGLYLPLNAPSPRSIKGPEMSKKMKQEEIIYEALPADGTISADELSTITGIAKPSLQACIGTMKKKGLVSAEKIAGKAHYAKGPETRFSVSTTETKRSSTSIKNNRKGAAKKQSQQKTANDDLVEHLLQANLDTAQNNLDEYVIAMCDESTLAMFRSQRDAAKKALEQYRGQHA